MHHHIIDYAKNVIKKHKIVSGDVLEVGSYNVNGSIRDAFQNETCTSYLGIDISPGPGVDRVVNAHYIARMNESEMSRGPVNKYDTVLCCEMLEHDHKFWETVRVIRYLTKVGGNIFISTPTFGFGEHRFPIDCYRFGVDAYREFIFDKFEILSLDYIPGPNVAGIARKTRECQEDAILNTV